MPVSVEIISIGTLSRNRFWNETSARRPAHATTTLLRNDESSIIVDPALPPEILRQRLDERTGPSSDTIVRVAAPGDPAAYIEDGAGTVRARVGYLDLGVNFVSWGGRYDHAYWLVVE